MSRRWLPLPGFYLQKKPNQHLSLYQGFAELIDGEIIMEGKGIVKLVWYPSPHISFNFVTQSQEITKITDRPIAELKLTESVPQYRLKVHCTSLQGIGESQESKISGTLIEPLIKGETNQLSTVIVNIPNFYWFQYNNEWDFDDEDNEIIKEGWLNFDGQLIFDYGNWHIVLAPLDNSYQLEELLNAEGGFGITHVCKLEKIDGKTFSLEEAYQQIEAFIYYLSFSRGLWIAPILISGFDGQGQRILEDWRTPEFPCEPWQPSYNWADPDSNMLLLAFPGFIEKWHDENWRDIIKNVIQWYVESSKYKSHPNTGIILIQSALEKLAWTYLKSSESLSPEGFKNLKAADQIRLFLKFLNIPIEPLDPDSELYRKAKELNWLDGASAIAEVRNAIVHPQVRKTSQPDFPSQVLLGEAFKLAHDYLEKCLLKLFNYSE